MSRVTVEPRDGRHDQAAEEATRRASKIPGPILQEVGDILRKTTVVSAFSLARRRRPAALGKRLEAVEAREARSGD